MKKLVAPAALLVISRLLACGDDYGDGATTADAGSAADAADAAVIDASGAGSSDAGREDVTVAAAACPLGCLPLAPPGWTGPSAVYDGADPTDEVCGGNYSLHEVSVRHLGTTAGHTCACTASASPPQLSCEASVDSYSTETCSGAAAASHTASAATSAICVITKSFAGFKVTELKVAGTCPTPTTKVTLPPPNVDRALVACGLPQVAGCEGRSDCAATPLPLPTPLTRLCIHQDGDVPCPITYAERAVLSKTIADDRSCTPCVGTPSGTCTELAGFSGDACTGTQTSVSTGVCLQGGSNLAIAFGGPKNAACNVVTGTPKGALAATDPVTFCCSK